MFSHKSVSQAGLKKGQKYLWPQEGQKYFWPKKSQKWFCLKDLKEFLALEKPKMQFTQLFNV